MQQLFIVGNVGRVDELRTVGTTSVLNFSVATNETYKDKDGNQVSDTTWWNCALWGKYAEVMAQYIVARKQVAVIGKIKSDKETGGPSIYQGQNGAGAKYEVTVSSVELLGKKGDTEEDEVPF